MTTTRTLVRSGAFALALAGGGIAGAMLGTPSASLAQDDPGDTDAPTTETEADEPLRSRPGHRGERLEVVAAIIGVEVDDLRTALREGQSIADVAEANGVDPDAVVDELVAQATERLAEVEEALPERMAELVEREGWGDRLPRHQRPGPWGCDDEGDRGEGDGAADAGGSDVAS